MAMQKQDSGSGAVWIGRLRLTVAAVVTWALLHWVVGAALLSPERPPVLSAAYGGMLAGLAFVVTLWVSAALATFITGARAVRLPLVAIGLGVALWAAEGGRLGRTIDQWLVLRNDVVGAPTGAPYWRLLAEYIYLVPAVAGAALVCGWLSQRQAPGSDWRQWLGLPAGREARLRGLGALALTTAGGALGMVLLIAPWDGNTLRFQVYFATAVGLLVGVVAAKRLLNVQEAIWYWPAPLLLGIVGLIGAGVDPHLQLSHTYAQLNDIPAWGLVRALPVELVGVGLAATLWNLGGKTAETGPAQAR